MANLENLFRRTAALIDDSVDNVNLADWFNECQDELLNILYLPTRVTLTKDATGFAVPENFNGELIVLTEVTATETLIYDGYIHFEDEDDFTELEVQYNKTPTEISTTLAQVPDIPKQFHSIYISYSAMQYCHVEEEFDRLSSFERRYNNTYQALQKYMSKLRPKPARWEVER